MECAFAPVVFQLKPLGAREHKLKPSLECSAMQNRPTCTALCARINIEINVFRNAMGKWADGGCCTDSPEQTCRAASVVVEWIWIGRFWSLPLGSALWSSIQLYKVHSDLLALAATNGIKTRTRDANVRKTHDG